MDEKAVSVLHVIPHRDFGGLREVVSMLDQQLPSHGIASSVLSLREELAARGSPQRRFSPALGRVALTIWRQMRVQAPSALLAHTVGSGLMVLPLARMAGVPRRVLVIHAGRSSLGKNKTRAATALVRSCMATHVIFVGRAAAESFGDLGQGPHARVVPNGVRLTGDGQPQITRSCNLSPDGRHSLRVLSAGRLVPTKRVDLAVRAALHAQEPLRLIICGGGPEEAEIRRLANRSPRIEFLGAIDRTGVEMQLREADVFIFPSQVEGLPLVLLEAAAAGAALVVRDTDFNREVVGDGALLIDSDDVAKWAEALDKLAADNAYRTRLRAAALDRASRFTPERMVQGYAEIIRGN